MVGKYDFNMLSEICRRCKCSVSFSYNPHKDYYQTVESYINDIISLGTDTIDELVGADIMKVMIETDIIVGLHFYPYTPIGFYSLYDWDIENILKRAIDILQEISTNEQ